MEICKQQSGRKGNGDMQAAKQNGDMQAAKRDWKSPPTRDLNIWLCER